MSLDRKDLRVYFSPELHAALLALADVDRLEPAKLAEQVLEQYVVERVHAANVIAQRVDVAGLVRLRAVCPGGARTMPDDAGISRSTPDLHGSASGRRGGR